MKAIIVAGSDSDMPHMEKIRSELEKYSIESVFRICSAHKQPSKCEELVRKYNDEEGIIFVAVAGGTDALSGVVSFHSVHPVVSCPPDAEDFDSCVFNPPGSSNALILKPSNVAKFCAQVFGMKDIIMKKNMEKIRKLEEADKHGR